MFAVGDVDGLVSVFDLNKKELEPWSIKAHTNNCSMIKFSSLQSNIVYSSGFDENLHMIDIGTK